MGIEWVTDPLLFVGRWWMFVRFTLGVVVGSEPAVDEMLGFLIDKGLFRTRVGAYIQRVCMCRGVSESGVVVYGMSIGDEQRVNVSMDLMGSRLQKMGGISEVLIELISSDVEYVSNYEQGGRFSMFGSRMMMGKVEADDVVVADLGVEGG